MWNRKDLADNYGHLIEHAVRVAAQGTRRLPCPHCGMTLWHGRAAGTGEVRRVAASRDSDEVIIGICEECEEEWVEEWVEEDLRLVGIYTMGGHNGATDRDAEQRREP